MDNAVLIRAELAQLLATVAAFAATTGLEILNDDPNPADFLVAAFEAQLRNFTPEPVSAA